jgi:hypothetical protein
MITVATTTNIVVAIAALIQVGMDFETVGLTERIFHYDKKISMKNILSRWNCRC